MNANYIVLLAFQDKSHGQLVTSIVTKARESVAVYFYAGVRVRDGVVNVMTAGLLDSEEQASSWVLKALHESKRDTDASGFPVSQALVTANYKSVLGVMLTRSCLQRPAESFPVINSGPMQVVDVLQILYPTVIFDLFTRSHMSLEDLFYQLGHHLQVDGEEYKEAVWLHKTSCDFIHKFLQSPWQELRTSQLQK